MQLAGIRFAALDGGLDQGDLVFPQNRIALRAAVAPIGIQGVQVGARLEFAEGRHEQDVIFGGIGGHPHIGNQLHGVLRVTGFGDIGDVALIADGFFSR